MSNAKYEIEISNLIQLNESLLGAFHSAVRRRLDGSPSEDEGVPIPSVGGAELGEGTATVIAPADPATDEAGWPEVGTLQGWRASGKFIAELISLTKEGKDKYTAAGTTTKVIKLKRTAATASDSLSNVHHLMQVTTVIGGEKPWSLWVSEETVLMNGSDLATGPKPLPTGWTREHWTVHVGATKDALALPATGQIFRDISPAANYFDSIISDQMYLLSTHYALAAMAGNNIYLKRSSTVPSSVSAVGQTYSHCTYRWLNT